MCDEVSALLNTSSVSDTADYMCMHGEIYYTEDWDHYAHWVTFN